MATSHRRLAVTCTGTVLAAFLAAAAAVPAPGFASERGGTGGTGTSGAAKPPPAANPAFGTFTDSGARGVQAIARTQQWLGGTDLRVGHTYLPGGSWSDIEGQVDFLQPWAQWKQARAGRLFVLNVPMLDDNEGHVPDDQVRAELRQGAAGQFDAHYKTLAQRLVDIGVPDTVIVLGWEMNGTTYTGRCGPDPASWKAYWKRIVGAMRSVPGQKFRFDFAPSRGRDAVPWTQCYPGDHVVDIVGMDSYDQPPGSTFEQEVKQPYGLQDHVDFAAAHGKPISYPEWGLFRNGDNPAYMRAMLKWIDTYKPVYNTLTDYCPHGVWQCKRNPQSAQVFRDALYGRGEHPVRPPSRPTGPPAEPTKPTEPTKPPTGGRDCTPLSLGDWLDSWFGGSVCIPMSWWQKWY
ncbi:glycoside hydrolase family 26 protein [Streptomyces sp. NRRL F-5126]|uniref:glycoside hydrolase family 26 protein n=1 Tax=Streptomyces sp. NRRL F-5126 TaxID=1463857 RepID=UPI000689B321|nr:glycosyl hydrolase [Streptomyces sp. NRRL F-5126]